MADWTLARSNMMQVLSRRDRYLTAAHFQVKITYSSHLRKRESPVGRLRRPEVSRRYEGVSMRITFKAFDSKMASREKLFKAAMEFTNKPDRKYLVNITHSEDRDNIVIPVWYWTEEADKAAEV